MIEIATDQMRWPAEFRSLGQALRTACGDNALAIHHIGSTAVPGLAAKDVMDLQMTVRQLDEVPTQAIRALGYTARPDIVSDHQPQGVELSPAELAKVQFSHTAPRRIHLHVREVGCFNTRYALLCFLRGHGAARDACAEIKRQLARYVPDDVNAYGDIKDPAFDLLMAGAEVWAAVTGWTIPPSEA